MRPIFADPKTDFGFALTLAKRQSHEEGHEEGREEGLREGVEMGLRKAIRALCRAFEIELGADREASLANMGADELEELQARLLRERRWS
jgi:flagellar biosynthesis/type III secretory pathway protein FliH